MMNWRDLITPPPGVLTHPHNPQNPQNGGAGGTSADIADIADEMATEKPAVFAPPTPSGSLNVEALAPPLQPDWLQAWRELAALTSGLTQEDPRLPPVLAALNRCDDAFRLGNWEAFNRAVHGVQRAMTQPLVTPAPPAAPLQPGWLVAYRDRRGALCGGCDDRTHGTVQECRWDGNGWTLCLTDGQRVPLSIIRSVGWTDSTGQIVAAWTVREHGYDGEGGAGR